VKTLSLCIILACTSTLTLRFVCKRPTLAYARGSDQSRDREEAVADESQEIIWSTKLQSPVRE
jgi:hypothetical protein